jgi:phenylacetate-coenzyme A ligase PaaK-like adenylate-forming protein
MILDEILKIAPYSLSKSEKSKMLSDYLNHLSRVHFEKSEEYRKMVTVIGYKPEVDYQYQDLPFLPVRLFKQFELRSIDKNEVFKTMTSSGTSGQAVSRIFIDRKTAAAQTKALTKIVSEFIGSKRLPMMIIDTDAILKSRNFFSARGAGILGFSMFGSKRMYALDEEMNMKYDEIAEFLEVHRGSPKFIFGFTFMIWKHFYKRLIEDDRKLDLSESVVIHGGGWKKLLSESVSSENFKQKLNEQCNIVKVHDYYGMVEQTGTIYMECGHGHLHCPAYSDVIIRRPFDFSEANIGEKGIIQVVSVLAESYPGHSLLTEDEGVLLGEDDCQCGRSGKYFKIRGRIKNAEIRGCSDTYAQKIS